MYAAPLRFASESADAVARRVLSVSSTELRVFGVFFFTFFTGLCAQINVPVPPFGIPISLQTLAVILCALTLGPRYGTVAMLLYVVVGALGVPMFAGGRAGIDVILGQTAGYLAGFVVAQPVICWCVRRNDGRVRGWGGMILAVVLGHMVIFAVGVPVLKLVRGLTWADAFAGGFVPFIPGLILKSGIAVIIGRIAAPLASRRIW